MAQIKLFEPFRNSSMNLCMKVNEIKTAKYIGGRAWVILSYAGGSYTISCENEGSSYTKADVTPEGFLANFPRQSFGNDEQLRKRYERAWLVFHRTLCKMEEMGHPYQFEVKDESILLLL